jgi:hypothetical protein
VFLGLGFLDTDNVGILFRHPVEKALAGRGTDAIGIETNNSHEFLSVYEMRALSLLGAFG